MFMVMVLLKATGVLHNGYRFSNKSKECTDGESQLIKILKTLQTVPSKVLADEARRLEAEAKQETPYRTGKLENSVRVKVSRDVRRPGLNISASARNLKTGKNYAGEQHENTHYRHPIKGKAFYLRDPFRRATARIKTRLAKELIPPGGKA